MVCNSRCKNAKTDKDKCKCSCGGENHGCNRDPKEKEFIERFKEINNPKNYYLCEFSFVPFPHEDPNPEFALGADVYAHIPYDLAKKYGDRNHALAIWKDIKTKEFVVRKEYHQASITPFMMGNQMGIIQQNISTGRWQEVYRGFDFQKALDMCTIYGHKYWNSEAEWKACDHKDDMHGCTKHWKVKV